MTFRPSAAAAVATAVAGPADVVSMLASAGSVPIEGPIWLPKPGADDGVHVDDEPDEIGVAEVDAATDDAAPDVSMNPELSCDVRATPPTSPNNPSSNGRFDDAAVGMK